MVAKFKVIHSNDNTSETYRIVLFTRGCERWITPNTEESNKRELGMEGQHAGYRDWQTKQEIGLCWEGE